ncbi:MAG: cytochrome b/b6 domain-containing protein [Sphingomicrobium sp.]
MKQPVWDLPTRLFHWTLVVLIGLSWWTAEEGPIELHIWSGLTILALLIFRLLWGLFGSSTARFSSFIRGPAAILAYVRDVKGWRGLGHNPLGALSALALIVLISAQVGLGLFNTDSDGLVGGPLAHHIGFEVSEEVHDLHEDLFEVLLVFIGLHIAAVLFYRLVFGKGLTWPMVTGRAELGSGIEPMRPGKWWVALLCLVAALAVTRWIIAGAPPFG